MALSSSTVDAAGARIRHDVRSGASPSEGDLEIVKEFRNLYVQGTLDLLESVQNLREVLLEQFEVGPDLEHLWEVAARPKTEDAIVAKLCRSSTRLSSMQDIAGARLVVPSIEIQDYVLELIVRVMTENGHRPRVKDTRLAGDDLGYRAIHMVLDWPPRLAEIQLRSRIQQIWAQLVERLDQSLGTDFKHGDGPPEIQEWLRTMSEQARRADLGEDFTVPPFPNSLS